MIDAGILYRIMDRFHDPEAQGRESPITRAAFEALKGNGSAAGYTHDLLEEKGLKMLELQIGQCYLIRTITHYYTGRVKELSFSTITLEQAAWIPNTGRFNECLRTGNCAEVEPFPDEVMVAAHAVVDAAPWKHPLPREVK